MRTGTYELWTMNLDGSGQAQLLTLPGEEFHPSYTPDGDRIVYSSLVSGASQIYIVNVAGGTPTQLTVDSEGNLKTSTLIGP